MAKRKRLLNCESAQAPKANGHIDELPGHILSSIVSCLEINKAIKTSVLSSRWGDLWKHITHLRFDSDCIFGKETFEIFRESPICAEEDFWRKHARKFIRSVNKTLRCHVGVGVETIEVEFPLDSKYTKTIDQWISFALSSGTKELCLILGAYLFSYIRPYRFPFKRFTRGRGHSLTCLSLQYCRLVPPPCFDGFKSLKVLDLDYVHLTDEDLESLVSFCTVLERLSVSNCLQLWQIKISHPCPQLKTLDVCRCRNIDKIDISALNLENFQYLGGMISFNFKNPSRLIKAQIYFDKQNNHDWSSLLRKLPFYLPQLKSLFLYIPSQPEDGFLCSKLFSNLNELTLDCSTSVDDHLLWMVSLLNAAPLLKSLDVQLQIPFSEENLRSGEKKEAIRRLPICPHHHLKTAQVSGFCGNVKQIELAIYLLQSSVALETMIISTIGRYNLMMKGGERDIRLFGVSQKVAISCYDKITEYISGELPLGVKLIIYDDFC